ncbi:MAG: mechanosensitive ion channel family protein [Clostridia bacterium]|nr:mechanosensitive ion channel family protein [Clostridia bacterium]
MKEKFQYIIQHISTKEPLDFIIAGGVLIGFIILSSMFAKLIMRIFKIKRDRLERKSKIYGLIKFVWIVTGLYISIAILNLPADWMSKITKVYKLITIYGLTRVVAQLVRPSTKLFNKFQSDENSKNENAIKFGVKLIRGLIYIIGTFIFIAELGYDLSGLITGLGIGSVVIALAAQDLAKNLFGGFAILTDKTFVIGESIKVGQTEGTIEDIGFRTTRVRKYDNSVATIPNSVLADSEIINWSKLQKRRFLCTLKVGLEVKQKEINDLIKKLSFEFQKDKDIIEESTKIYFSKIDHDGYEISIIAYTNIVNYDEYLEFVSQTNSLIIEVLDKERIKLVYPTYDVSIKK